MEIKIFKLFKMFLYLSIQRNKKFSENFLHQIMDHSLKKMGNKLNLIKIEVKTWIIIRAVKEKKI
jgi:hypothetical protein